MQGNYALEYEPKYSGNFWYYTPDGITEKTGSLSLSLHLSIYLSLHLSVYLFLTVHFFFLIYCLVQVLKNPRYTAVVGEARDGTESCIMIKGSPRAYCILIGCDTTRVGGGDRDLADLDGRSQRPG